jgi:DmsE family decaheme c-type cytochrome
MSFASRTIFFFALAALLLCGGAVAQQSNAGVGAKRTPRFTGEGVEACLLCHSGEKMQAVEASRHGNTENPYTPYSNQGCESCHGPGSFHVSRAHGGKGFPKMITFGTGSTASSRDEQISVCLSCHEDAASGSSVIGFSGSVHDKEFINCSTCHEAHAEYQPIGETTQQVEICFTCHARQRSEHPRMGGNPIDFDSFSCRNCHGVHRTTGPGAG